MTLLFLHGLESGPHGTKYQALKKTFGSVISPDCSGIIDPQQRLQIIMETIKQSEEQFLVIGSSMGGLMALLLQQAAPERIAGMVLCAPALHRPAATGLSASTLPPTVVIHGRQDTVVPIAASRKFGCPLLEVDDDHSLKNSLTIILSEVAKLKNQLKKGD
ncbi:MAG: YqiA/YcfP family alpha/beta fold hydrolase [Desulfuromusa sp.]|nr:YqiA/YcfP family alpha/beta fold hydrolase [Desulfuromusa sp.]